MHAHKQARSDHLIHELIARRWSVYAFSDRSVSDDDLRSMLETARWAPSSYNEQPWSYLPEAYRQRDLAPRQRKPLAEFVFGGQWGTTSSVVA